MKYTAKSPANIAFIKYWGAKNHDIFLPHNSNLSMCIEGTDTITTVELVDGLKDHDVQVAFYGKDFASLVREGDDKKKLLFDHIDRILQLAGSDKKAKVRSKNNFPADAGIASSASSFSALTLAVAKAAGLDDIIEDKKELSKLIRLGGSVSAMRSAFGGFVECVIAGDEHDDCYAEQIADENHWDLVDIVAVVDPGVKEFSSLQGHRLVETSEFFHARLDAVPERLAACREAIMNKDFKKLGEVIEADAISMHCVMMSSKPPVYYWNGVTMDIINALRLWRKENLLAYFTIDAGPNVHVICQSKDLDEVKKRLEAMPGVQWTITSKNGQGAHLIDEHLF